uniref:Peptidase aspartic putative domain-containing protein n=1 Tax=Bactrocera latifrons TaxID=174628 RepID=A0A0K8WEE0_BACLA
MAPQTNTKPTCSRQSSPTFTVRSLSVTRSISPLSDEGTLARRLHRFKATLSPIREERGNTHRTARRTISRSSKRTHKHVACGLCKKDHRLVTCSKFTQMNINEKFDAVIKYKYCVNCLARSHSTQNCTSKKRCSTCNGEHHSILHGHPRLFCEELKKTSKSEEKLHTRRQKDLPTLLAKPTLIPTVMIKVKHDGKWNKIRAIINPTRKVTIIASELVQRLRLPKTYLDSHRICKVVMGSLTDSDWHVEVNCLLTHDLPTRPYNRDLSGEITKKFDHLVLADPTFWKNDNIMLELGADVYPRIMKPGLFNPDNSTVIAQNTALGWTLTGACAI